MATRTYEVGTVAILAAHLRPSNDLLDVGANSGCLSFMAKAVVGGHRRVVAVAPRSESVTTIRDSRQRLNHDLSIGVLACAVPRESGDVLLHLPADLANARIEGAHWSHEKRSTETQTVLARTLDDLVDYASADIVKVHIEGAEGAVLETSEGPGAWRTRPTLLVQYHGMANREACRRTAQRWRYSFEAEASTDDVPGGWCLMRPVSE